MIADLKDREPNRVTPFVIVNFSHHEHLHLPKDHVVAFAEKDCNEGEVLEICTMEQLEKDLPRNWIPDGIQPLPEKLESIAKMPAPKNPKEVKQVLGLVDYYRKFM